MAFTSYNKHPRHYLLDEVVTNVDAIFSNIDRVNILDVCGGEPFLSPVFYDSVDYIASKYRDNINILRTVTNGTTVPSDALCELMKKINMTVLLDDYRHSVSLSARMFDDVYRKLKNTGVNVIINKVESWFDLGVEEGIKFENELKIMRHFDECGNPIRSVHNGKLFICDYADFAREAGFYHESKNDYMDLLVPHDKAEVLEFLKGYSNTGSCGMCKYCEGREGINKKYIGVAVQQGEM